MAARTLRQLAALLALTTMACSAPSAPGARPDPDAGVADSDGSPPEPFVIAPWTPEPRAIVGSLDCPVPGRAGGLARGEHVLVNDCVECQCTTEGTTCQRRPDCGRDVCVAVDGVEIPVASAARVAGCHDCTCRVAADGEPTLACVRAVDGDCPTDGCATPLIPFLAVGAEEFTSECHRCVCDADAGMRCENVCHPSCPCGVDGLFSSGCDALCDDDGCEATIARGVTAVAVPTMARVSRRGLDCVCDYSEIVCLEPASRPSP